MGVSGGVPLGTVPYTLKPGGYYGWTENAGTATQTFAEAELQTVPLFVPHAIVVDRLGTIVAVGGTTGAVLRFGIYEDDGAGSPGDLIVDAGTVTAETTGFRSVTLEQALQPGPVWLAMVVQGGAGTRPQTNRVANSSHPAVRPVSGTAVFDPPGAASNGYVSAAGAVTGALPSTALVSSAVANAPLILYRVKP